MEDIKKLAKFSRNGEKFVRDVVSLKYDYSFVELDRIMGDFTKHTPLKI